MRRRLFLALLSPMLFQGTAQAGWLSVSGRAEELKGYTIVLVGDLAKKGFINGDTHQRTDWYELTDYVGLKTCLEFPSQAPEALTGDDDAVLVVKDERGKLELAFFQPSVGDNVKVSPLEEVAVTQCPDPTRLTGTHPQQRRLGTQPIVAAAIPRCSPGYCR